MCAQMGQMQKRHLDKKRLLPMFSSRSGGEDAEGEGPPFAIPTPGNCCWGPRNVHSGDSLWKISLGLR
jgi:hypothetical protein